MKHKIKKHWYRISYWTCPVCGASLMHKKRVYESEEPKPKNPSDRITEDIIYYCGCMFK